ncbi:hypothetical protein GCM10023161_40860 [Mycobacterium paraffinicum]|uniref:Uncharacterized protein n=1 Tax=Mycobacterium paraffinicum TaxID=53378 RepID=A0ABP8F245_9MYCO
MVRCRGTSQYVAPNRKWCERQHGTAPFTHHPPFGAVRLIEDKVGSVLKKHVSEVGKGRGKPVVIHQDYVRVWNGAITESSDCQRRVKDFSRILLPCTESREWSYYEQSCAPSCRAFARVQNIGYGRFARSRNGEICAVSQVGKDFEVPLLETAQFPP